MVDPLLEQLLVGFVDESQEIYDRVTRHLLEFEKAAPEPGQFDDVARGLHTLKGSAATLGLEELADFAHRMEDVLLPLRGTKAPLPAALADALLRTLDLWMQHLRATAQKLELPSLLPGHALLSSVQGPKPEAQARASTPPERAPQLATGAPSPAPSPALPEPRGELLLPETQFPQTFEDGSWRVNQRQVTGLLREVERLRELRLRIEERRREVERGLGELSRKADPILARELFQSLRRALAADGEESADIVNSMEDGLKTICTLPMRTVLEPLRRAVRDLCKQSGKEATLSVVGAEISLDRRVLEALRGPLVHLVRNAVDHGLELPAQREASGKHREGALVIRLEQHSNMLFVEVADDVRGLDLQAIKDTAVRRGMGSQAELDAMTPAQLHQLIFRSGFSTRTEVSETSGRGVGLDVVRAQIQELQGHVEVESTRGQGTRFILNLPADLGSSPVLVVRCGEHQLGLPMVAVESSRTARGADLRVGRSRVQLQHREQLLEVKDLGAVLGLRQAEVPQEGQPLLIVASHGRRIALSVDEVVGDKELVIRPLPAEVRDLPAYQGAATLARGELVLVVRADFLVQDERRDGSSIAGSRRALVVDDSLTARALHRTALEAGGYLVHAAASGRQALEQLRHAAYDVMVSDIGMDEMDGYQLTQEVRRRPETDGMPIILVSARDQENDRSRGASAGADGFLSKKDCVSGRLLAEVAAVIARRRGAS